MLIRPQLEKGAWAGLSDVCFVFDVAVFVVVVVVVVVVAIAMARPAAISQGGGRIAMRFMNPDRGAPQIDRSKSNGNRLRRGF